MKTLVLLTPAAGKTAADFAPLLVAEERAVWAAYRAGTLREMYFQPDPVAVTLVFEAADHAAVHATLAGFSMVAAGLLDIRIVTLGPWVPLEHLFAAEHRT